MYHVKIYIDEFHKHGKATNIICRFIWLIFRCSAFKKEVKIKPNCVTNEDKKRKVKSLEPALGSGQHSNPKLSHLASNSGHENPNLGDEEISQANPIAHEVCIDGWTITYKEFQPRRINQFRKKVNQGQRADNTRIQLRESVITTDRKDTM